MDNKTARQDLETVIRVEDLALGSMRKLRGIQDWLRAQPEDMVPMPQNEDQARAMALTGMKWLEDNAPDQLITLTNHSVLSDISRERRRQDQKWGGPAHDDQFPPQFWTQLIQDYAGWARVMAGMGSSDKYRNRLVQIAALAVAAVDVEDRTAFRRCNQENTHGHTAMPAAGKVFAYIIKRRKYAALASVQGQMNRFTECREARR